METQAGSSRRRPASRHNLESFWHQYLYRGYRLHGCWLSVWDNTAI